MRAQMKRAGKLALLRTESLSILLVLVLIASFQTTAALAQERIRPSDAERYIGKRVTVCGQVASANFAARSRGRPTFLNLDRPYPNQIFTIVIWGDNRAKFGSSPEQFYRGRRICVMGTISSYRGQPQIVASDPSQITDYKG